MKDENEKPRDLKSRTKQFALRIIRLFGALPKTTEAQIMGKQVLRSGTTVGAHYREAMRARSNAVFVSKIDGGLAELEETIYWIEVLTESGIVPSSRVKSLLAEANELTAVLVACVKNAKRGLGRLTE
jgi:four helix bundle protein